MTIKNVMTTLKILTKNDEEVILSDIKKAMAMLHKQDVKSGP